MYEKLVKYAAKQLELDASEITPIPPSNPWALTLWTSSR